MTKGLLKYLVLSLVFVMILTAVVGCGKSADTSNDDQVAETPSEDVDEPAVEEPVDEEPAAEPEPVDLGGREIRIGAWWDLAPVAGSSVDADNKLARIAEMEEKYNMKIVYMNIPWAELHEQIPASVMAGDPILEIATIEKPFYYPGFVGRGLLYPLSDLEAFDFENEKWNQAYKSFCTYDGKVYGMRNGRITEPRSGIFFNKTMFEREGMPMLYDLVDNDQWNWDKMLELAKKATRDLDGDGVIDQFGLGGGDTLIEGLVYSNGGAYVKEIDGKPVYTADEPVAIEALQFMQDLIHTHKVLDVPPEGASWEYDLQRFQDGVVAMSAQSWWPAPVRYKDNMPDDYGYVPVPKGPKATEYASALGGINFEVMPMNVKDPEIVAMIYNELTDPYPDDQPDDWKEGYLNAARDIEAVDMIEMMNNKQIFTVSLSGLFGEGDITKGAIGSILRGEKTAQVAVSEIKDQVQLLIDDTMADIVNN